MTDPASLDMYIYSAGITIIGFLLGILFGWLPLIGKPIPNRAAMALLHDLARRVGLKSPHDVIACALASYEMAIKVKAMGGKVTVTCPDQSMGDLWTGPDEDLIRPEKRP